MSKRGSIGIDVGGTKTLCGLFNSSFDLLEEIKIKTPAGRKQDFAEGLAESVKSLMSKASARGIKICGVGVGCSGTVDTRRGVVQSSLNIPSLKNFSFRDALSRLTHARVVLHNDVNAALYGELKLGAAIGSKHVIGVFIGTGIGGAVAVDGKLYVGASGHAGDIGHYLVQPFGPLAGSERYGVLDDVASRTAIAGEAAVLAAKQWAPHLFKAAGTDVRNIKSSALAKAIRAGDKSVEELVRSRAQIVGIVLSNIVDFFNPEMIVLGGGLVDAMPKIIRNEVAAGIHAHATADANRGLKVVTAKLKDHAVTMGAAKLALDTLE